MIDRNEILTATGSRLDEIGAMFNPPVFRSEVYVTSHLSGSHTKYEAPKSDKGYRKDLLSVLDSIRDGGPAFGEFQQAGNCSIKNGGMSLRDYFAAKALAGLCAEMSKMCLEDIERSAREAPGLAYALADAMLAERAK